VHSPHGAQRRGIRVVDRAGSRQRGLYFTSIDDLDATEKARILGVFEKEIFPVLTPLAVDPAIRSLHLEPVAQPGGACRGSQHSRAAVRASEGTALLPRFVPLNGGSRFVASSS